MIESGSGMITDDMIKYEALRVLLKAPFKTYRLFNKGRISIQCVIDDWARWFTLPEFSDRIIQPLVTRLLATNNDNEEQGSTLSFHVSINSKSDDIDFYILKIGISCS